MIELEMNVITFRSTHHAIKTEKELKKEGINIKVIPTPREITSSCGLSIRFNDEDKDKVLSIINDMITDEGMFLKGIYKIKRTKEKVDVIELNKGE